MNKFLLTIISGLGILLQTGFAQDTIPSDSSVLTEVSPHPNLVKNPGFEEKKKVINGLGQIKVATGWGSVSDVGADLYSSGAKPGEFSTFGNKYGMEVPQEGNTYAGFLAYSLQNKEARSYIYGKLDKSLKKGVRYCTTISISLADKSKFALQDIGVLFTDKKAKTKKNQYLLTRPQVLPSVPKWRSKSDGWDLICNSFKAKGGEEYIVLGNFFSNHETLYTKREDLPEDSLDKYMPISYYYVDEIKVQMVDSSSACNCETKEEEKYVPKYVFYSKSAVSEDTLTLEQRVFSSAVHFLPFQDQISHLELEHDSIYNDIDRLRSLANVLKENPDVQLNILGHSDAQELFWPDSLLTEIASLNSISENVDSVPTDIDNKRIKTIIDFLCSEGIDENRLIPMTKGFDAPIDTANNPIARAKNRRVDFQIVGLEERKRLDKIKKNEQLLQKDVPSPTFKYIESDTIIDPKDQD